jgi:hypothetical protein
MQFLFYIWKKKVNQVISNNKLVMIWYKNLIVDYT